MVVRKAAAMYEPLMASKPIGKRFPEAYDPLTIKPRPEWLDLYDRVKEQAAAWGLCFR